MSPDQSATSTTSAADAAAEENLTSAALIEEVSIDGMCGVY